MAKQSTHEQMAQAFAEQAVEVDAKLAEQMPALAELASKARWMALDIQGVIGRGTQAIEIRDGSRMHAAKDAEAVREAGNAYAKTIRHTVEVNQKLEAMVEAARELDRMVSDLRHLQFADS